jgi:hypothetical protein
VHKLRFLVGCRQLVVLSVVLALGPAILSVAPALGSAVFSDNFNDNSLDTTAWLVASSGGPTVAETNQRLEATVPSISSGSMFFVNIAMQCQARGDFDAQVDYVLLTWPSQNGVRIGLLINGVGAMSLTRPGYAAGESSWPGSSQSSTSPTWWPGRSPACGAGSSGSPNHPLEVGSPGTDLPRPGWWDRVTVLRGTPR